MKTKTTIISLLRAVVASAFLVALPVSVLFSCSGKSNDEDDTFKESTTDRLGIDTSGRRADRDTATSE